MDHQLLLFDIPLMAGVALVCVLAFATGRRVSRAEGGMFVAIYAASLVPLIVFRT